MKRINKKVNGSAAAQKLTILLVALCSIVVFFFPEIFLRKVIYCCDNLTIIVPMRKFFVESVQSGVFPLWNPFIFSGSPYFADINLGILHPFTALYFFLSPLKAVTYDVIGSFAVSIIGVYILLRVMRLSSHASITASIIYTYSGAMAAYSNNLSILHTASLLPLSLATFILYLQKSSARTFVAAVGALALQIVSGHPQITYYAYVIVVIIVVTAPIDTLGIRIARFFKLLLLVGLITAIQTLPFIESAINSSRSQLGYAYASSSAFTPTGIIRLVLPNAIGNLSGIGAWAQYGVLIGFVGIIPLLLSLVSLHKSYYRKLFTTIGVIAFLGSFGALSPIFTALFRTLPGFGAFRAPEHLLILYTLSVAILSGYGFEALRAAEMRTRLKKYLKTAFLFFVFLGIGSFFYEYFSGVAGNRVEIFLRQHGDIVLGLIRKNIFIEMILIGGLYFFISTGKRNIWRNALIVLVFAELFIFSRNNILSTSEESILQRMGSEVFISELAKDVDWRKNRVFIDPKLVDNPVKSFPKYNYKNETVWQSSVLKPNLPMMYGLPIIDGYASMVSNKYKSAFDPQHSDPTGVQVDADNKYSKLLGIKYIVMKNDGEIQLVQSDLSCPRLFLLDGNICQEEGIRILSYSPNELRASVRTESLRILVFADSWFPGWEAFIDGSKAPISEYLRLVKSMQVPKGDHVVTFKYNPLSFRLGLFLSTGGVLIIGYLVLMNLFLRNHKN